MPGRKSDQPERKPGTAPGLRRAKQKFDQPRIQAAQAACVDLHRRTGRFLQEALDGTEIGSCEALWQDKVFHDVRRDP